LSCSSGVGRLSDHSGWPVTQDLTKGNILNDYFASVCINDNCKLSPFPRQVPGDVSLDNIYFDTVAVMKIICKLKPKLSHGPDGITPFVIKKLGQSIVCPLSRFFESFMSVGQVPSEWMSAIVTPTFKKGISSDFFNYRPVSLCCGIQQIIERIIG